MSNPDTNLQRKAQLRKLIAAKASSMQKESIATSDHKILLNLLDTPEYQTATVIFTYVGTENEVDTKSIISKAIEQGKRVCVPRCVRLGIMHAYEIRDLSDLQIGRYNIPEPKEYCEHVTPEEISLALVPCVTCNFDGHRLGYGGGFYDRYLFEQRFTKIALCRSVLIHADIPIDTHDIPVDIIITDEQVVYV